MTQGDTAIVTGSTVMDLRSGLPACRTAAACAAARGGAGGASPSALDTTRVVPLASPPVAQPPTHRQGRMVRCERDPSAVRALDAPATTGGQPRWPFPAPSNGTATSSPLRERLMRICPAGATLRLNRSVEPGFAVEVNALAAIGRDQRLLVIRPRDGLHWVLPGAPVTAGEPVEDGLRRTLREEFGASTTFLAFLAAIEHCYTDRFGTLHHELDLIFDAGLADLRVRCADESLEQRWVPAADLAEIELVPSGLSRGLLSGRFDEGDRWLPWRPYETPDQARHW